MKTNAANYGAPPCVFLGKKVEVKRCKSMKWPLQPCCWHFLKREYSLWLHVAYFRAYMTAEVAHGGYNKNSMAICSINGTWLQQWYLVSVKIGSAVPTNVLKKGSGRFAKMRSRLWLSVPLASTKLAEIHGNLSKNTRSIKGSWGRKFQKWKAHGLYSKKKVPIECGQALCALQHQSLDISFSFLWHPLQGLILSRFLISSIAASLWNSSHRILLPVHRASAHLISAHAIHPISCLL